MTFTYKLIKNPMTGVEDGVRLSSDTDNIVKIIDIKNDSSDVTWGHFLYVIIKNWL